MAAALRARKRDPRAAAVSRAKIDVQSVVELSSLHAQRKRSFSPSLSRESGRLRSLVDEVST